MKSREKFEYGDFQTPMELAHSLCQILHNQKIAPRYIVEPTCGKGNFLLAGLQAFPEVEKGIGVEINQEYVEQARASTTKFAQKVDIVHKDFFCVDWEELLGNLVGPVLLLGNPPWVTNSDLGAIGSDNLPKKNNFHEYKGLDALTGKSNFDIAEWMLLRLIEWTSARCATMAMLCKTAVARKVLGYAWKKELVIGNSRIITIDAKKHFGAAVDACFFVAEGTETSSQKICDVFVDKGEKLQLQKTFGYDDSGNVVANITDYWRLRHLEGDNSQYCWRSGVKHDCSKVMELRRENGHYANGFGEIYELEDHYLYPLLKSSEIAKGGEVTPKRWMIVTQRRIGDETAIIADKAPKTWRYLCHYADLLQKRASSIYKNKPSFSIFGVGDYTYAPWKVAISGFYKKLFFRVIGLYADKPIVLDDTCYFLSCKSEGEALLLSHLLNSQLAQTFFRAIVFWDAKRPITISLLRRLDIAKLADELSVSEELAKYRRRDVQTTLFC